MYCILWDSRIANVSPCHINYEDTHNTLLLGKKWIESQQLSSSDFKELTWHDCRKYANRAKNIKTKAVRNAWSLKALDVFFFSASVQQFQDGQEPCFKVAQVNYHVSKYTEIIKDLRSEIQELKAGLSMLEGMEWRGMSLWTKSGRSFHMFVCGAACKSFTLRFPSLSLWLHWVC